MPTAAVLPLTAADLMTEDVFTIGPEETLDAVLDVMIDHGVRHVPVVDEDGTLIGIVSHRDLLAEGASSRIDEPLSLTALAMSLSLRRVEEVMSVPDGVEPGTPVAEVARIMRDNQYGCVPVVENERLVGIITEADFVRALAAAQEEEE